jgi:hypothetical protein
VKEEKCEQTLTKEAAWMVFGLCGVWTESEKPEKMLGASLNGVMSLNPMLLLFKCVSNKFLKY